MDLEQWVQAQHQILGVDKKGQFIGKKIFKDRLIAQRPIINGQAVSTEHIRQFVNRRAYDLSKNPPEINQPLLASPSTANEACSSSRLNDITSKEEKKQEAVPHNGRLKTDWCPPAKKKVGVPQPKEPAKSNNKLDDTIPIETKIHHNLSSLNPRLQELRDFAERSLDGEKTQKYGDQPLRISDVQSFLLQSDHGDVGGAGLASKDDIRDATFFSADVLKASGSKIPLQYALFGSVLRTENLSSGSSSEMDSRIFHNTNMPFSVFICGLQGGGKSHTLSCLIENCLIQTPVLGTLQKPLSAIVLHFSQYTSHQSFMPCEAAFLAYPSQKFPGLASVSPVNVLVAPSNYHNLKASYETIPGVNVQPFRLRHQDLNVGSMLSLMSVDQSESVPLYIGQITKILRDMASTSPESFDYNEFKRRLKVCALTKMQRRPLEQRLELLESFLVLEDSAEDCNFGTVGVTIIDLSCPFVDVSMACVLFNIGIGLYMGSNATAGKIIAVDEAHKYMTDTPASKILTESLLSVIRQQRHLGARVIISTQEPTISPRLMDLCAVTVIHRFTSPEWFNILRQHISMDSKNSSEELFNRIVNLRVGNALLFAPSALLGRADVKSPQRLGSDLLHMKVRKRLTWDGGKSIVCL